MLLLIVKGFGTVLVVILLFAFEITLEFRLAFEVSFLSFAFLDFATACYMLVILLEYRVD